MGAKGEVKEAKGKCKSVQHPVFPGRLPSKCEPGPTLRSFPEKTGSGEFSLLWPKRPQAAAGRLESLFQAFQAKPVPRFTHARL